VGTIAHVSSPCLHYEKEKIVVELTGGKNRRRSGCFGPATANGSDAAPIFIEGALRLASRGIRGRISAGERATRAGLPFIAADGKVRARGSNRRRWNFNATVTNGEGRRRQGKERGWNGNSVLGKRWGRGG
jgi:hypothetical protein